MTIQEHDPASFTHKYAIAGGYKYHYVEEGNSTSPVILLIHGFPDLWYGWRHQIKFFANNGYRVIAIDCLGYGETDAPEELNMYSLKNLAGQIRDLLDVLEITEATLVGHDWGGAVAFRFADWHPECVKAIVSVCTPGLPFGDYPVPVEMTVEIFPTLRYLLYYTDPDLVPLVDSNPREFLKGIYESSLTTTKQELDYMTNQFEKTGFEGPLNYYKTGLINYNEELEHPTRNKKMSYPVHLIKGENDPILIPELAVAMPLIYKDYHTHSIQTGHFAMLQKPQEFNEVLEGILKTIHQ